MKGIWNDRGDTSNAAWQVFQDALGVSIKLELDRASGIVWLGAYAFRDVETLETMITLLQGWVAENRSYDIT